MPVVLYSPQPPGVPGAQAQWLDTALLPVGGETLAQTLALGNETGGTSIVVTAGDIIQAKDDGASAGVDLELGPGHGTDDGAIVIRTATGSAAPAARGVNSVDLTATRALGTQVASGDRAVCIGGRNNTASALDALAAGDTCEAGASNAISMGLRNIVGDAALASCIVGGRDNTIQDQSGFGYYAGIFSGDSNLIRQNSYGSVIVGGTSNIIGDAAGSYYCSTAAVLAGRFNYILSANGAGSYNSVAAGANCEVLGAQSAFAFGIQCRQYGNYSMIGGNGCDMYSKNSFGWGENLADDLRADGCALFGNNTRADTRGQIAFGGASEALSITVVTNRPGNAQGSLYVLGTTTTNATPTELHTDGGTADINTASFRNLLPVPNNSVLNFTAKVQAYQASGTAGTAGDTAAWDIEGTIKNVGGTTTLVGVTGTGAPLRNDAGAAAWTMGVTADNTNDTLVFTGTGEADKNIVWSATLIAGRTGNT